MRMLDLYCGQGGAAVGYHRAWKCEIVGVDNQPQPRYPFQFVQADALDYLREHGREFGFIHASPVCKGYSTLSALFQEREYPDDIAELRTLLQESGKPYVIENVPGAPLQNYVMLCGSMFGLPVYRHRNFECNPPVLMSPFVCNHWAKASASNARSRSGRRVVPSFDNYDILTITGHDFIAEDGRRAMEVDWMSRDGISQAIPPAYTEWLAGQLGNPLLHPR